jgi:hypothetical protein
MLKTKNLVIVGLFALSTGILFTQCSKSEEATTTLRVRLTDNPTALDEVNIDLLEVRVNFRDDSTGWITLPTTRGFYNLLALQNGVTTMIGTGAVPQGILKEIRLILGPANTVKENGVILPLTIPSGSESGVKIKVDKKLAATLDSLVIDFDAALSVKRENDGWKLKPVLKLK